MENIPCFGFYLCGFIFFVNKTGIFINTEQISLFLTGGRCGTSLITTAFITIFRKIKPQRQGPNQTSSIIFFSIEDATNTHLSVVF